jgi:hypothetical protein
MAQIDLRNAIVRIKDGYAGIGAGAVNNGAGYAAAASVIAVDGFTGAIVTGDYVKFTGHNTLYTVTAHTETLGNTTSITISPALTTSVLDNVVVTVQPHQIEVLLGDGNCTYDEKRSFKYIRNRNELDTVRQEQDEPVEVSLDATWEFVRAATGDPPTIEDCLKKRGEASGWTSSSSDLCEPYAVDVEIEYTPPCTGEDREVITLNDFRYESFNHDLKAGTFAVKGKCNITEATVVRAA